MAPGTDLPEDGELVVATVRQVKNFGVVVDLDEYPGKEGFIHIAEVASGWVKYIRDHVREGQKVVCKVLGIDTRRKNKFVDLSLKAVNEHQKREKIQQWKSEQKAQKLVELICQNLDHDYQWGMEEFGYDLIAEYGSLYSAFEVSAIKESALGESGFEGDWIEPFISMAKENITPPFVEISGVLEMTSNSSDGMEEIKEALSFAEKYVGEGDFEDVNLNILYIGAPRYRLILSAPDYKTAEEILKGSADAALSFLDSKNGTGKFIRKG
jgi:translation initiation factor 2 subunit 1